MIFSSYHIFQTILDFERYRHWTKYLTDTGIEQLLCTQYRNGRKFERYPNNLKDNVRSKSYLSKQIRFKFKSVPIIRTEALANTHSVEKHPGNFQYIILIDIENPIDYANKMNKD